MSLYGSDKPAGSLHHRDLTIGKTNHDIPAGAILGRRDGTADANCPAMAALSNGRRSIGPLDGVPQPLAGHDKRIVGLKVESVQRSIVVEGELTVCGKIVSDLRGGHTRTGWQRNPDLALIREVQVRVGRDLPSVPRPPGRKLARSKSSRTRDTHANGGAGPAFNGLRSGQV